MQTIRLTREDGSAVEWMTDMEGVEGDLTQLFGRPGVSAPSRRSSEHLVPLRSRGSERE